MKCSRFTSYGKRHRWDGLADFFLKNFIRFVVFYTFVESIFCCWRKLCHKLTGRKLIHRAIAFGIDSILSDSFDFFIVLFFFSFCRQREYCTFFSSHKPVFILHGYGCMLFFFYSYQDRLVFIACLWRQNNLAQ